MMLELAAGLEKTGIHNVISSPKGSYLFQKAKEFGLTVYPLRINGSFDPIGILGLRSIVKKENIEIIHAHQGKVFWPCVFMKWFVDRNVKLVFHRHAQLAHRVYSRGHYRSADNVIAISRAVARGLIEREQVPEEKVSVVYNGINLGRFNPSVNGDKARREYKYEGCTVIGTAAAMNRPKGKGQRYLIEAAKILKPKYPNLRYLIVGTGEIKGELEKAARELGVDDIVDFTGYKENVEEYMAAMDIFCLLSWDTEGLGQVMMEAQAMAKPVIGTNVGGVPETFINNGTGLLIGPENSGELAKAIEYFAADKAKITLLGRQARDYALENFGIEKMVKNVRSIYDKMTL